MRKKRLKEKHANLIIEKCRREGTKLYKYICPHCQGFHLTKRPQHQERDHGL